jgi:hypothetical protein
MGLRRRPHPHGVAWMDVVDFPARLLHDVGQEVPVGTGAPVRFHQTYYVALSCNAF